MKKTQNKVQEDMPNSATTHHGSTTQGGSNFGQGSSQLGNSAIAQRIESDDASTNNDNPEWNNEALRKEDLEKQKK